VEFQLEKPFQNDLQLDTFDEIAFKYWNLYQNLSAG
jgi:hypothetical protein